MDQSDLEQLFLEQAEYRAAKAKEYPDDSRNSDAEAAFRDLARTAKDCPDDVIRAAEELHEDLPDFEVWNEMIRQVGFHSRHDSAEQFVRTFIAARSS